MHRLSLERRCFGPDSVFDVCLGVLDYISSMGIRLLLQCRKLIEGCEGKMVMANLQP
ncbi:MAG: hypothetical protein M2R45_01749 [Verrucomicrobia subdivision 3 bacterium]|nr:hypothetical protein [Limisphaerales bacterium]MCS1413486.1 hypothetical protein [Limisphaerales bacterium]